MQSLIYTAPSGDKVIGLPGFEYTKADMYSGYLDVASSPTKKLHYIFIESEIKNDPKTPLTLWLNGGPGCSSLLGFVYEHGPFYFKEGTDEKIPNPYNWNKFSHMLYLEAPAGVGFSIAGPNEYAIDDDQTAIDSESALVDWFNKFSEYADKDFYISGESYAGIYIPYLANVILKNNLIRKPEKIIKLKGLLIGNGLVDLTYDNISGIPFYFNHGLISKEVYNAYNKNNCDFEDSPSCNSHLEKIYNEIDGINIYDIYHICIPHGKQDLKYPYTRFIDSRLQTVRKYKPLKSENQFSYLEGADDDDSDIPPCADFYGAKTYLNKDEVKKALNVGKSLVWEFCSNKVGELYKPSTEGSIKIIKDFLENQTLRIWKYSGSSDSVVAFNGTRAWIDNLKLKIADEETEYKPWSILEKKNKVAGYYTQYEKNFRFITFDGVGHVVPQWARAEAFHMFKAYINDIPLDETNPKI